MGTELNKEAKVKKGLGKKFIKGGIMVIAAILILFIGTAIGSSGAKIDLNKQKLDAEGLQKDISTLKNQKKDTEKQLSDAKQQLSDQKTKNKDVFNMISQKDQIKSDLTKEKSDLSDVKGKISDQQSKLSNINDQIKSAQSKLSALNGDIIQAKGKPITLDAGQYLVGHDFPPGRYKAHNIGRGTNLFVDDSNGTNVVNTILGNDIIGSGDYVFFADNNYTIDTRGAITLTPVK